MIALASRRCNLRVFDRPIAPFEPGISISLKWPRWYAASAEDRQRDAQTLATLAGSGHISRNSAVRAIADTYDIEDVSAELHLIEGDRTDREE
jgi:hypothetical protein